MKHAVALPQYSDVKEFTPPAGVAVVKLDKVTNRIADAACPDDYYAAFIAGTEPHETCDQNPGLFNRIGTILGITARDNPAVVPPPSPGSQNQPAVTSVRPLPPTTTVPAQAASPQQDPNAQKKKGFWGKLAGVFKGDDDKQQQPPQSQAPPPPPKQQP
jgi:penicillin-binding protein 1B